jgi:hypothetical protein
MSLSDFGLEEICRGYDKVIFDHTGLYAPLAGSFDDSVEKLRSAFNKLHNCRVPKVVFDEINKDASSRYKMGMLSNALLLRVAPSIYKRRQKALRYRCQVLGAEKRIEAYNVTALFYALAHPREAMQHGHIVRAALLTGEPVHAEVFAAVRDEFQIPNSHADVYVFEKGKYNLVTVQTLQ